MAFHTRGAIKIISQPRLPGLLSGAIRNLLMAKAGADVIKIEPPQSEPLVGANRPLAGIVVLASVGFLRSCHSGRCLALTHDGCRPARL